MTDKSQHNEKMNFNAAWCMAVGGMIGGGIFSVLGVIVETAGQWAWLSFLIAGIIALLTSYSYSHLSLKYNEGGGSYTFLRRSGYTQSAGNIGWILIAGYILTISVYAFTFGHYVAHVFDFGSWLPRLLAVGSISILAAINLRGVSNSSLFEVISVWIKLVILISLAIFGLMQWAPDMLSQGIEDKSPFRAIIGAATIFMAYEGFQLLSYDYDDIDAPRKNLPLAMGWAVVAVIITYIIVALGATMLVGADTLIEQKEVALSIAGKQAFGITGLILVTIGAAFSTGSAINATLFSTARLMEKIAKHNDLPKRFKEENDSHIPYVSILCIAFVASILAAIGNLSALVDSASLIFLITFGIVNYIGFHQNIKRRYIPLAGFLMCLCAIIMDVWEEGKNHPYILLGLTIFILFIFIMRPKINKHFS